jgi:hypothetical protein
VPVILGEGIPWLAGARGPVHLSDPEVVEDRGVTPPALGRSQGAAVSPVNGRKDQIPMSKTVLYMSMSVDGVHRRAQRGPGQRAR